MGCGRVGSTLAQSLGEQGHEVAVIDQESSAVPPARLGLRRAARSPASASTATRSREAGIERAYAFAAVCSGDNSNILAARVARETFGVENVVARIYDPRRAEVYQRLGIPTVATVRWTVGPDAAAAAAQGRDPRAPDPSGRVVVAEVQLNEGWVGERLSRVEDDTGIRVAFVTRLGEGLLPVADTVFQDGDLVHVLATATDRTVGTRVPTTRLRPARPVRLS